jgi:pyruvate-ferredoxin/flavodoxin oxidoreductase
VQVIAVLDRTKEPGSIGEPLYLDVVAALREAEDLEQLPFPMPRVIGGRYGLSSKEFSPAMVKAVFDELAAEKPPEASTSPSASSTTSPTARSSTIPTFDIEPDDVVRAVFFGLGADGTVGANKNSIKIIGEDTPELRPGVLRLRLEEVGGDDHLAPPLRAPADPLRRT